MLKKDISVLDCTLRDGGFINDWDFGKRSIRNIYMGLIRSGADIIEIGYIRNGTAYTEDRAVFPDTRSMRQLLECRKKTAYGPNFMTVAILDYGQCDMKNIACRTAGDVDGIRLTFKHKDADAAIKQCSYIQSLGYKVFVQPVSITDYTDFEIISLVEKVNKIEPYAFSIVDTYGFMQKQDVMRLFTLIDHNLKQDIRIGYHAHNNFQLAYSNAVAIIESHGVRPVIIDTSIYGMGKSAGNACTELMMNYINETYGKRYFIEEILELIDSEISKFQKDGNWGYAFKYYLASAYRCHPQYVDYLVRKKTISVRAIVRILGGIPKEIRTSYDEKYIRKAYLNDQLSEIWDDEISYRSIINEIGGRPVVVFAPGRSYLDELPTVQKYLLTNHPYIISVNGILPDIPVDAIFFKNEKRYQQYQQERDEKIRCYTISTKCEPEINQEYVFCMGNAIKREDAIDNTTIILLYVLQKAGVREVALCGMDGFLNSGENFIDKYHSLGADTAAYDETNRKAQICLNELSQKMKITFVTSSIYHV